ncbi:unnamed protein product [Rhizopus stolonifer]
MDKIREKINSIRAEADAAIAKADALEAKLKEFEQEQTRNEREIVSLTNRNKQLEEDLDVAHEKIKDLKGNEDSDIVNEHENAQRKITLLEQELEDSDRALKQTTENFREADVKSEQLEKKVEQLTIQLSEEEKKREELESKNKELKEELDEFSKQLDEN